MRRKYRRIAFGGKMSFSGWGGGGKNMVLVVTRSLVAGDLDEEDICQLPAVKHLFRISGFRQATRGFINPVTQMLVRFSPDSNARSKVGETLA